MTDRARVWTFVGILVVCITIGTGYLVWSSSSEESVAPLEGTVAVPPLTAGAIVIRGLDRRSGRYGEVAVVDPAHPSTPARTGLMCERVAANMHGGMCLARAKAFGVKYDGVVFGPDFRAQRRIRLDGIPSRTRLSSDGRYAGVTSFVGGHSYAELGEFSTHTLILDRVTGRIVLDLEDLAVTRNGKTIDAIDVNFWGVTFAPSSRRFYATLATGGATYLIQGTVGSSRAKVLHENAECPSVSPDGRRVAYKKRIGDPAVWHFYVLDLASGRETALAEPRPIDDQLEWLNDKRLLYRVDEETWSVPANGMGTPTRFLPRADSATVIRG